MIQWANAMRDFERLHSSNILQQARDLAKNRPLDQLWPRHNSRTGGVAEWSNAAVSKTVIGASLSRVRIPPPPPVFHVSRRKAAPTGRHMCADGQSALRTRSGSNWLPTGPPAF